jgi:hypothetical protein
VASPKAIAGPTRPIDTPGRAASSSGGRDGPAIGVTADDAHRCVDEDATVERLLLNGWSFEVRAGFRPRAESEVRESIDRLVATGLGFKRADRGRLFDPFEVINVMEWAGQARGDPFWPDCSVVTARRLVLEQHGMAYAPDVPPPPPRELPPKRFRVDFRREFPLVGHTPGARTRLRLPLPIEDGALGDLVVEPHAAPELNARFATSPGRLDAVVESPQAAVASVAYQASFTAYPSTHASDPAPLSASDAALYTRPNEGFAQVSDRVRRLAAELAGGETDSWTVVRRFWDYAMDALNCGCVHYDELDAARPLDWILENGWFDCQLGSALIVALCRARSIPARMVSGFVPYQTAPCFHYWFEVFVDGRGWTALDLICWDLSGGGRDPVWRDYHLGEVDYRMKTECLPRIFGGGAHARFPKVWHSRSRLTDEGTEIAFHDTSTGALIYRDQISARVET